MNTFPEQNAERVWQLWTKKLPQPQLIELSLCHKASQEELVFTPSTLSKAVFHLLLFLMTRLRGVAAGWGCTAGLWKRVLTPTSPQEILDKEGTSWTMLTCKVFMTHPPGLLVGGNGGGLTGALRRRCPQKTLPESRGSHNLLDCNLNAANISVHQTWSEPCLWCTCKTFTIDLQLQVLREHWKILLWADCHLDQFHFRWEVWSFSKNHSGLYNRIQPTGTGTSR